MATNRDITVNLLADIKPLEAAFIRAGLLSEDTARKIEAAFAEAGASSDAAAVRAERANKRLGAAFEDGTNKAAGELHKLGSAAQSWGVPFGQSIDKVGQKFQEAEAHVGKFRQALVDAGKLALVAGTAGFAAAAAEAATYGVKFQSAMRNVRMQAQLSTTETQALGKALLGTMGHAADSATQFAQAYGQVGGQLRITEGHILSTSQAMKVMDAAYKLSEASGSSLSDSTSALTSVMQGYDQGVAKAAGTSNLLYTASRALNVPLDDAALALARLHGRLGMLSPSLSDVSTLMVDLAKQGLTSERGIRAVGTALQTMVTPSKKNTEVLQALGVNLFNSKDQFIGLQNAIAKLSPKLASLTQEQQLYVAQTLFGKQAGMAMLEIIKEGPEAWSKLQSAVTQHNAVNKAAEIQEKGLSTQLQILKSTVVDLAIKIGTYLIPKFVALSQAILSVINWFSKNQGAAIALGGVISGVLGAAIGAFVGTKAVAFVGALKGMGTQFGLLATKVGESVGIIKGEEEAMVTTTEESAASIDAALLSSGIGAALASLAVVMGETQGHWSQMWDAMKQAAIDAANFITQNVINPLIRQLNKLVNPLAAFGPLGAVAGSVFGLPHANLIPTIGALSGGSGGGGAANGGRFGGSVPGWSSSENSMGQGLASVLTRLGLSRAGASGVIGNLMQESTLNLNEPGGYLAQWQGSRLTALLAYAKANHENVNTMSAQVGFMWHELQGMPALLQTLRTATNPQAAAIAFEQGFEHAGIPMMSNREQYAAQAFLAYFGKTGQLSQNAPPGLKQGGAPGGRTGTGRGNAAVQALINQAKTGSAAVKTLLYTSPLAGDQYTVTRTDQGKDFADIHGAIGAIGAGVITLAQSLQGFGQTIVEKLTQGPNAGRYIYYGLETGATPVAGLHTGQTLRPGQQIATGLGTGGVEFGFWNPATGRSEGAPYFNGSNATPPGTAFAQWMAALAAHSTYTTTKNGVTTGGGANFGFKLSQLEQAFTAALIKAGNALIQRLANAIQNGTVKTLESLLGVNTMQRVRIGYSRDTKHGAPEPTYGPLSALLYEEVNHPGRMRTGFGAGARDPRSGPRAYHWGPIYSPLGPDFLTSQQHEYQSDMFQRVVQGKHLTGTQVANLTGMSGNTIHNIDQKLIPTLTAATAHSTQNKAYEQQVLTLLADGQKQEAERLVSAHKAAIAALAQEMYAEQVTKNAELVSLHATFLRDQTQKLQNYYNALLTVQKSQDQKVVDKFTEMVTTIRDMTQSITDHFAAMVQSVQDAATAMTDSMNAVAQGISDQAQVQVDILGERGLYGLNLIAQKLQVVADQDKMYWDQQIAAATKTLDEVTANAHQAINTAQAVLDQTQIAQDAKVAIAQQHLDTVTIIQNQKIAEAQRHADSVQLHEDVSVVGPAQIAVDLNATSSKAQQDVFNAILHQAQGQAGVAEGQAGLALAHTTYSANSAIQAAQQQFDTIQGQANVAIANAQQSLATITGQANEAIANATANLSTIQGEAGVAEAQAQAAVSVAQETASTEFTGTGTVVNIYGVPLENATDVGAAFDWLARTQL